MTTTATRLTRSSIKAKGDFQERPFLASRQLQIMLKREQAVLDGTVLSLPDGRLFALQDAVRVLGHARQETDPYGLCGVVVAVRTMLQRGFSLNANQAALGRVLYDVEYGYLAQSLADPQDDRSLAALTG